MRNRSVDRIVTTAFLVVLLLLAPWQVFFLAACALLLWFPRYDEAVVAAFFFDLLYRPDIAAFHPAWSMTLVIAIFAILVEILRTRVRLLQS